jgi:cysteine synthase
MPADEDVVAAVLVQAFGTAGTGMATAEIIERGARHCVVRVQAFGTAGTGMATAEIIERGARHCVVRVTYLALDIITSEEQDQCNT